MQTGLSILTILWSMSAAACFMLALMHLEFWSRSRSRHEYLLSSTMAAAAGCTALLELAAMFATDISTYLSLLKLQVACIGVMLISLVWFVRTYLAAGSRALLYAITVLWVVSIGIDFLSPTGSVFTANSEIASARTFWGESFALVLGETNPWKYLADVASALILMFLLHATVGAWRGGSRQRAVVVGGGSVLFITLAGIHAPLVDAGIIETPYMVSFAFLLIVAALSYQVVYDAVQADRYARELETLSRGFILGEVAAGLAHELNQPLAAILSNAQAARRYLDSDSPDLAEIGEIIEDIIVDDKRAGQIIHGLRSMLQQESRETTMVRVNTVIESVIEIVGAELRSRGVTIDADLRAERDAVLADTVQLQQVLINLLINAARSMTETPPEHRCISIRSSSDGDTVNVSVSDHGSGISDATKSRLFEPFFSTHDGGLGMGLAICKRIVERHGGRIWAEARSRGGSVFRFDLPRTDTVPGDTQ
ncbi:MAG: ATP-binding protein [Gammaproteobacteria bacterium]